MLPSAIHTQCFAPLRQPVDSVYTPHKVKHLTTEVSSYLQDQQCLLCFPKIETLLVQHLHSKRQILLGMCNSPRRSYKLWGRHTSQYRLGTLQVYYWQWYNTLKKWEPCSIENQGRYGSPRWGGGSSPLHFLESHMPTLQPPSIIKLSKSSQVLQPEFRDDRVA